VPTFTYKARDEAGKAVKGELEAVSKDEVASKLHEMGYMVSRVDESFSSGVQLPDLAERFTRVKSRDMILFNIQLANMLSAGITLLMCLKILQQQFEEKKFKKIIGEVTRSVEAGSSFSEALGTHPRVFNKLFVSTVKAGESSGNLDRVLTRLAAYVEYQDDLKEKIQGALFYPMVLLFAGIAVILIVVTFLIPQFVDMFTKAGVALPLPTQILYAVGIGLKQYWYFCLMGLGALVFGAGWYRKTDGGELFTDRMFLKIPVVGGLVRKVCISRFARTLSTLVASGVPMLHGLSIVEEIVGNRIIARVVRKARDSVESGSKIAEPLKVSGEFPVDVVSMISVGEETGDLDGMLNKIADFYDRLVSYAVKRLTTLIEPFFLVLMGGLVGLIMASVLLPIFDMAQAIRH